MKCRICGAKVPMGIWESACPECGARYPSFRNMYLVLGLYVLALAATVLAMLLDPHAFDWLIILFWTLAALVMVIQIIVVRRRRKRFEPSINSR